MYKPYVNKKNLRHLLDKPVFRCIDSQSMHHVGILEVALRTTELVGDQIMTGKTRLIDYILSHAITCWHASLNQNGVAAAYNDYCDVIFNSLSQLFDYTVTGKSKVIPFYNHTWDCTSQTYFQWVSEYNINPSKLNIVHTPPTIQLDKRSASYILSSRVFNRHDMCNIGLASEIHHIIGR
jgi:hypothetical protein